MSKKTNHNLLALGIGSEPRARFYLKKNLHWERERECAEAAKDMAANYERRARKVNESPYEFRVGDIVRVSTTVRISEKIKYSLKYSEEEPPYFLENMEKFKGTRVTITEIVKGYYGKHCYRIKEDGGRYVWNENWLYSLEDENSPEAE